MRVKDAMSADVMSLSDEATVLEAAELLANTRVSAMPVLDRNGAMVGIVSEVDLMRATAAGVTEAARGLLRELAAETRARAAHEFARQCPVVRIMTTDVVTIDENALLVDAVEVLEARRIKRLPVVSGQSVVGMVTRADILQALVSAGDAGPAALRAVAAGQSERSQVLRRAVMAALRTEGGSLAQRLDVVVIDRTVHLWGVVPSREIATSFTRAANVEGVTDVRNHMHVTSP